MTTRRTFLTQAAIGVSALPATPRALGTAGNAASAAISPALLKRAESLLEHAPLIDTHNDLPSSVQVT